MMGPRALVGDLGPLSGSLGSACLVLHVWCRVISEAEASGDSDERQAGHNSRICSESAALKPAHLLWERNATESKEE